MLLTGCGGFLPFFGDDDDPAPAPPPPTSDAASETSTIVDATAFEAASDGAPPLFWSCTTQPPSRPYGVEVDCNEIRNKLLKGAVPSPIFIKGFVVFEVPGNPDPPPLDVTTVYTSHGWDLSSGRPVWKGFAEDIESVLPKRVK